MSEDRRLRILYHHRIAAADGMAVHVSEIVSALRALGHEVRLLGPPLAGGGAGKASTLERLADAARRRLPAAVYELAELGFNLLSAARLLIEVQRFRPHVIYERYNLFLLAGVAVARLQRIPLLLEVNAPLLDERRTYGRLRLQQLGAWCERALWRGADAVLPVTEVLAQQVRSRRGHGDGVQVIPNGGRAAPIFSPQHLAAVRAQLGFDAEDVLLGFVGFVRDWHGLGDAVEALPNLSAATKLVVVGDGPGCASLAARAGELGVGDRVRLLGRMEHARVAELMATFDVALQTAATAYASPLKLFEYMALGRAIIAPDQPNIREVLTHGVDALLFDPADPSDFVGKLGQLTSDAALRRRLGSGAARTHRERPFTWTRNAERIAALARALAVRDRASPAARGAAAEAS